MSDREQERRLAEAKSLIDNPLLIEALDRIERDAVEDLLKVRGFFRFADAKRRSLIERIHVARGMRRHLEAVIMTGEHRNRPRSGVA